MSQRTPTLNANKEGCWRGGVRRWDRCPNALLSPSHTPLVKPAGGTIEPRRKCLLHNGMSLVKKRKYSCDRQKAGDRNFVRLAGIDSFSGGSGDRLVAWICLSHGRRDARNHGSVTSADKGVLRQVDGRTAQPPGCVSFGKYHPFRAMGSPPPGGPNDSAQGQ